MLTESHDEFMVRAGLRSLPQQLEFSSLVLGALSPVSRLMKFGRLLADEGPRKKRF